MAVSVAMTTVMLPLLAPGTSSVARALTLDPAIESPTNVCAASNSDGFTVDWDAPLDPAVTGFVVEYVQEAGGTPIDVTVGSVTSAHVVAAAGVKYRVNVASVVGASQSNWGTRCLVQWGAGPGVSLPTRVPLGDLAHRSATSLAAAGFSSCAVTSDGAAVCWDGSGTPARIANGALSGQSVTKVVVGSGHACALTAVQHLACWGANDHGQLGDGTVVDRVDPVAATVGALSTATIIDVAIADHATCVLTSVKQILCWGLLAARSLATPTAITGGGLLDHPPTALVGGAETACAMGLWTHTVGTPPARPSQLVCWGANNTGQILLGGASSLVTPATNDRGALFGLPVDNVSLDGGHGCAIAQAAARCWGARDGSATGQPATGPVAPTRLTAALLTSRSINRVVTGDRFGCVSRVDGQVVCWGDGAYTDGTAGRESGAATRLDRGALAGGGADLLAGHDDVVIARWDGLVAPSLGPSKPHLVNVVNSAGSDIEVSWTAPASSGAAASATTRVEWSPNGTAWTLGSAAASTSPTAVTLPAASYAYVRARAESAAGVSDWDVIAAPMSATGTANVRVTLATALAEPLVGATVSVLPDGALTPISGITDSTGSFTVDAVPQGRAKVSASGGHVGASVTVTSSTFDVFVPGAPLVSGRVPVSIVLPPVPAATDRLITTVTYQFVPVPKVGIEYGGGVVPSVPVDLGVPGAARAITWARIGASFPAASSAAGTASVKGLVSPLAVQDVGLRYDDTRVHVRLVSPFRGNPKVILETVASPSVRLPSPMYTTGASGITIQVGAYARPGGWIKKTAISIVNTSGVKSVTRTGCVSKTSGVTDSTGFITFRLCPTGTATWHVVLPVGVPSTGFKVEAFPAVSQLSAGAHHICARLVDSTVTCTGDNQFGQVGAKLNILTVYSPARVPGLSGVASVSSGSDFTCALLSPGTNGSVKCWGRGAAGRLGDGTGATRIAPKFVTTAGTVPLKGVSSLATGEQSACVVIAAGPSGTARCWGANTSGQLGDGTTTNRTRPVTVMASGSTPLRGVVQVTVGQDHACARLVNGAVKCWGANQVGQLGNGALASSRNPMSVSGIDGGGAKAATISAGRSHTCAVLTNGNVRCWGANTFHILGAGPAHNELFSAVPLTVMVGATPLSGAKQVDGGAASTCAIAGSATSARLWCWGNNSTANIGDGTQTTRDSLYKIPVTALNGVAAVSVGGNFSMALVPSATRTPYVVYGWGLDFGGLGSGDGAQPRSPLFIGRF